MIYTRDLFTSELFRVNLLSRNLVHCELPTELEALRESHELTVKTETVGYVNITSNWIGEIQQCFWSTQQPYGKISTSITSFWVAISLLTVWKYVFLLLPDCMYLSRTEILSMLGTGSLLAEVSDFSSHFQLPRPEKSLLAGKVLCTFWKSQKLIRSEKNQCVLVLKISFCKNHQSAKINFRKNLCHTVYPPSLFWIDHQ